MLEIFKNLDKDLSIINTSIDNEIKKYRNVHIFSPYNHKECSICLNDYEDDDNIIVLKKCYHYFHDTCFQEAFKLRKNCSLCRKKLNKNIIQNIYNK
jgi:hypothetical protein